jgi:hypothetical protein
MRLPLLPSKLSVKAKCICQTLLEAIVMVQPLADTSLEIIYPDSDNKSMADNTEQFRWIVTIKENNKIL